MNEGYVSLLETDLGDSPILTLPIEYVIPRTSRASIAEGLIPIRSSLEEEDSYSDYIVTSYPKP